MPKRIALLQKYRRIRRIVLGAAIVRIAPVAGRPACSQLHCPRLHPHLPSGKLPRIGIPRTDEYKEVLS